MVEIAVAGAGVVVGAHVWLAVVAAAIPLFLTCVTVVVLVFAVERDKRIAAIKALPPLIAAIRGHTDARATARNGRRALQPVGDVDRHDGASLPGKDGSDACSG